MRLKSNKPFNHGVICLVLAISASLFGCGSDELRQSPAAKDVLPSTPNGYLINGVSTNVDIWPTLAIPYKGEQTVEQQVAALVSAMTLEQKIAQMIQPEIRDISVEDMRQYGFGSYLNGGGAYPNNDKHATPADWIALAETMYQASIDDSLDGSRIPTMWGTDAVHGHNNVIGATLFPHNIGLGAANNPELIRQIAAITAKEVMVTGIDWVFAPTVAVVRDDRWGRAYEGYSEDPEIVRSYSQAIVEGLQGKVNQDFLSSEHVISTVKHFLGDGGTEGGDDQGDNLASEQALFDIHGQGYVGGLTAGAQTVMASFNSWHGVKNHGNSYLLTDVLKDRMGFDGFVVGDWNGHGQIPGCTNESCPQAVNAGLDVFMVPTEAWKPLYHNTLAQAKSGLISMARIDDAVSRILRVKIRAGLFDKPSPAARPLSGKTELIGQASHRDIAKQAVRESLVLLKNNDHILPLSPSLNILVAGDAADNIGKQSGGWTITWQGTDNVNADFPGASSIYAGIAQKVMAAGGKINLSESGEFVPENRPDVAIVVFGEEPYAEGNGDIDNLEYQRGDKKDLALLKKLQAQGIPVVSIFISGRPMWVNPELNASTAFVAAWLPGSEGDAVADVLFQPTSGQPLHDFKGKLSFSWPATASQTQVNRFDKTQVPLFTYGYGLTYADTVKLDTLSEQVQVSEQPLEALAILRHTVKAPWRLLMGSVASLTPVSSSMQTFGPVSMRTMDRVVQEDARLFQFDGHSPGAIRFNADFSKDLRAFNKPEAVMSFDVKLDSLANAEEGSVQVSLLCADVCDKQVDLTPIMQDIAGRGWQTIQVELGCFGLSGENFAKIQSPFSLTSSVQLDVQLSEIAWLASATQDVTLKCH